MSAVSTRRSMLGLLAAAPAVALVPAAAMASPPDRRAWGALVADYRAKRAAWLAAGDAEDQDGPSLREARASLPPEPEAPSALPDNFDGMTFGEIMRVCNAPAHKAAWAEYERERAAWKAESEAILQRARGPAKTRHDRAYAAFDQSLAVLSEFRVPTLRELGEKIEIIAAEHDGCEVPLEYLDDILADVRRLGRIGA